MINEYFLIYENMIQPSNSVLPFMGIIHFNNACFTFKNVMFLNKLKFFRSFISQDIFYQFIVNNLSI